MAPLATYRLQLTPEFGFAQAADLAEYLAELGVSHAYLSPILEAVPGSAHGYDVTDHSRIRAEFGGEDGFRAMAREFRDRGLGVVVDIVPNHMAVHQHNRQLWDVLAHGQESGYAHWFDIDWAAGDGRFLLPILDDSGHAPDIPLPREDTHYKLIHWRAASTELNWRRFFDVTTLIGIRQEDPAVFQATHELLLRLIEEGLIDGLRVDHPDGLADPRGYFSRLGGATGDRWVVAEKILERDERLPADWRCAGTTGYDALALVDGLFVDPAGRAALTALVREPTFAETAHRAKHEVTERLFPAELARLTRLVSGDADPADVHAVLVEIVAAFPVYRAYVHPGEPADPASVTAVTTALGQAKRNLPQHLHGLADRLADAILGDGSPELITRFQQTTGPVLAKGVEDTASYRWPRLLSLNEVGSDPDRFGVTVPEFHAAAGHLAGHWPHTMTTLSTHDTKRQEDVRARLAVLAECPPRWQPSGAIDAATEYFVWQTLVGAWPIDDERLGGYLTKAIREAKTRTSWTDPVPGYEQSVLDFAKQVPRDDVAEVVRTIAPYARANSLGAKLVQLTMPGVPDVYQGCELGGFSLVDPDNRRPVDHVPHTDLDREKLLVTRGALHCRRDHPALVPRRLHPADRRRSPGQPRRRVRARTSGDRRNPAPSWPPKSRRLAEQPPPPPRRALARRADRHHARRRPPRPRRPDPGPPRGPPGAPVMTAFRVWAPNASQVELDTGGPRVPMHRDDTRHGWWHVDTTATDYAFRLDGGDALPDPRSLRQPHGPDGPSRVYDHQTFAWTDQAWRPPALSGSVSYELHIGTFTAEGTFDAAIAKLGYLRELGVSAVEVMPVAAFPGEHGWGYDGIGLWAVHEPYGGPDGLKRFVDQAHARGLAVILDVVYNHVGIGNRLADFGPYFTGAHTTPWGPAVNLDQPGSDEVRAFLIENALMWLRDFHIDALRLDAVHALQDNRALHFLTELAIAAESLPGRVLIAESDTNDPRVVSPRAAGGYGIDAQWSDDFHHAVHAAVTGERQGYYADFGTMAALAKTIEHVFFHNGVWSSFRGRTHGREVDVARTPGYRFLGYLQNHDQVGNRAAGDRMRPEHVRIAAALVLTSPFMPMLFMGEEWGADTPWQYFTDHTDPVLARAVRDGRRAEFAMHGWAAGDVPDPQDRATFLRSKLDWTQPDREPYASMLAWYRELLALRRAHPELADPVLTHVRVDYDEQARWIVVHRGPFRVAANLGSASVAVPVTRVLAASSPRVELAEGNCTLPPLTCAIAVID